MTFRSFVPLFPSSSYKYFVEDPFLHFGFGLSYTTFDYVSVSNIRKSIEMCESFNVTVTVANTGAVDGDEIVQLYITLPDSKVSQRPKLMLAAFQRVSISSGTSVDVTLTVDPQSHFVVPDVPNESPFAVERILEPGRIIYYIGGGQPVRQNLALTGEVEQIGSVTPLSLCKNTMPNNGQGT